MSGHNKWGQIKRQKGSEDAKRSKLFSMIARQITLESKKAGGNVTSPNLRSAIEKARKQNMPNDNIDRAVKRGVGSDAQNFEEFMYEAYGPGGVALIIEGLTDSKNRTLSEIKHILSENGSSLASQGSALWAFVKSENGWTPNTPLEIGEEERNQLDELIDILEEHDDVKGVYTNANLSN